MRIAIIHESWGAGAARCAQDLQRELGVRHEICYFPRKKDEVAEDILRELSEFAPDVVNCHSFYGHLAYDFLAVLSNRHATCFTVHDPRPIGTMQLECWACEKNAKCRHCPLIASGWRWFLQNRYYRERKAKRKTHKRCAADMRVVAPSRWMLGRLAGQELSRFNLRHIPNGIDLKHFRPMSSDQDNFGLPADRPIILFSSWYESKRNISHRKGLSDLTSAFISYVVPSMPEAILAVAGESFVPNHPNVRPLGMIPYDRLPQMYTATDVYVTPTLADNLPYTVLEAMGCEVPVIASNVGGLPEQVVHDQTGLLVPPSDPAALGAALLEILSNPTRARLMGINGRRRAQAVYSMEPFVSAYERLFQEMTRASEC